MGETPDQLRAEIAGTRADMTATVDAIADRTNPRNAARRQVGRLGQRVGAVRETIMGSVDDMTSSASGTAGSVQGSVQGAAGSLVDSASGMVHDGPDAVRRQTKGNPMAAGLIAFGAGLLVASVIPSTEAERRTAAGVADQASPVVDQAKQTASEMADQLKSSAQDAAGQLKESASGAADQVRQQAGDAASQVGGTTKSAAQDVGGTARAQTGR